MVGSSYAQSNLPACQGGNTATWSNCWGTFTFPGGDRVVSEYQNGMRNGQGIEYAKNGSVLRSGTWKNDQLVSSYVLDKSRFPFDPQALTVATNNQSTNFSVVSAFSQSNLPDCQGSNSARWSNCLGTFTFPGGDRVVSEYQNGMRNGQGIEYAKNGSVLRSGTWKNDQLVSSYVLDKSRFPIDPQALTVATNNQSTNFSVVSAFSQSCPSSNGLRQMG